MVGSEFEASSMNPIANSHSIPSSDSYDIMPHEHDTDFRARQWPSQSPESMSHTLVVHGLVGGGSSLSETSYITMLVLY